VKKKIVPWAGRSKKKSSFKWLSWVVAWLLKISYNSIYKQLTTPYTGVNKDQTHVENIKTKLML